MNDPTNVNRDAFWPVMGRAMAAALARAPGLVTRAAPGAWRVTSDIDLWMANWVACYGVDAASRAVFRAALDDAVASGRSTPVAVSELGRDGTGHGDRNSGWRNRLLLDGERCW